MHMTQPHRHPSSCPQLPPRFHWSAAQLTDAVPMKPHEQYGVTIAAPRARDLDASAPLPQHRRPRTDARPAAATAALPPRFRIG